MLGWETRIQTNKPHDPHQRNKTGEAPNKHPCYKKTTKKKRRIGHKQQLQNQQNQKKTHTSRQGSHQTEQD
jgi:hypothetical protein